MHEFSSVVNVCARACMALQRSSILQRAKQPTGRSLLSSPLSSWLTSALDQSNQEASILISYWSTALPAVTSNSQSERGASGRLRGAPQWAHMENILQPANWLVLMKNALLCPSLYFFPFSAQLRFLSLMAWTDLFKLDYVSFCSAGRRLAGNAPVSGGSAFLSSGVINLLLIVLWDCCHSYESQLLIFFLSHFSNMLALTKLMVCSKTC